MRQKQRQRHNKAWCLSQIRLYLIGKRKVLEATGKCFGGQLYRTSKVLFKTFFIQINVVSLTNKRTAFQIDSKALGM